MSKRSIAYTLSLWISTAVISILVAFIIISYRYSRRIIHENVDTKAMALNGQIISQVKNKIVTSQEIASNLSFQIPFYVQHGGIDQLLNSILYKYNFVQAITIELRNENPEKEGTYFYSIKAGDSIRFSTGINSMFNTKHVADYDLSEYPLWTEPIMSEDTNGVVSTYCQLINGVDSLNKPQNIGKVYVDVSLSSLQQTFDRITENQGIFSFLVSKSGSYITHPIKEWVLNKNIKSLSEKVYGKNELPVSDILNKGVSGKTIAYPEILDYKKSWVYYTHIPENGWFLVFVEPFSEAYKSSRHMLLVLGLISGVGLILILIIVIIIARRVMNPLAQIASEIHEFSFWGRSNEAKNEVVALTKSLSQIRDRYQKFKIYRDQERKNNKKFKYDLEQASDIQKGIVPNTFPAFPDRDEVDIFSIFKPAFFIGGDLYDYFYIDENHLLITIGDVSGKGIPAALFMGVAQTLLRSLASNIKAKNIVRKLNNGLCEKNNNQFFLTMFVGILDVKTGVLNYCNAAHTTSYILKNDGKLVELRESHGLPLGLYADKKYKESSITLLENDTLILYSDGITEAANKTGDHYGVYRFKSQLKKLKGNSPKQIIGKIETDLEKFKDGTDQNDDLSFVVAKYHP